MKAEELPAAAEPAWAAFVTNTEHPQAEPASHRGELWRAVVIVLYDPSADRFLGFRQAAILVQADLFLLQAAMESLDHSAAAGRNNPSKGVQANFLRGTR